MYDLITLIYDLSPRPTNRKEGLAVNKFCVVSFSMLSFNVTQFVIGILCSEHDEHHSEDPLQTQVKLSDNRVNEH